MSSGRDARGTALVVVNADPWRLRRTHSTVGALEADGWRVVVASPPAESLPSRFGHVRIGAMSESDLLRRLHGVFARNLMRLAITVLTLLPQSFRKPAIAGGAVRVLRLEGLVSALREEPPAVVIVHDPLLIAPVLHHRNGSRVVFDAREFFPRQFEHSFIWRTLIGSGMRRLMKQVLPECDAVTTVSKGLRDGYRQLVNVDPVVVLNVPGYTPPAAERPQPRTSDMRLRVVYHGGVNANRGLSDLIAALEPLDDMAELDLYLVGPRRLLRTLERRASRVANVNVRAPVAFSEIHRMLTQYDAGLAFFRDRTFNLRHAMPSKFFEYLQAGLAVVVGPSPDMVGVVRRYDCGAVAESFAPSALTAAVASFSADRLREMQEHALLAAESLCVEVEYDKMQELVEGLAGRAQG